MPVDGDIAVAAPRARRAGGPRWFAGPDGLELRYDPDYVVPATGAKFSANWQLRCPCPEHRACVKKKHCTAPDVKDYGPLGALAFLYAWVTTPKAEGKTHIATPPTAAHVAAVAAARGDELRALLRARGLPA